MNSSFVGCIPSSACQRDQKRMEQTLKNDPLWQNTMEYAQFFPIVGSQIFLVPSSLHVPRLAPPRRIDPCQWICGHAPGAIGQLKAAQLTLLSTLAMKSVSPISPYSILFKVIQMCFFRFDWLTQFCWSVLFWLSQGWTARTLDLPMKSYGFGPRPSNKENTGPLRLGAMSWIVHVKRRNRDASSGFLWCKMM